MPAWFCTACFKPVAETDARCPSCGARLDADDRSYEQKLIAALRHKLPDRRLIAARALGMIRSRAALHDLQREAQDLADPYLAAESVKALARIGGDDAWVCIAGVAEHGPAPAKAAAREALDERDSTRAPDHG